MSDFFDYREVACPGCGHLNRRFGRFLLDGRYASQCDHCGVELATGRFSWTGAINRALLVVTVYFFVGLVGVLVALIACHLLAWMMLGPRYEEVREGISYAGVALGMAAGVAFAERQRRREGLAGRKRLVPDAGEAPASPPEGRREGTPDPPVSRAAFRAKTAREWSLGLGYLGGALVGMFPVSWILAALGRPELFEAGLGLSMVGGLVAGWAWGRWKHAPPPPRRDAH